jgi:hypothetical protein
MAVAVVFAVSNPKQKADLVPYTSLTVILHPQGR